MDRPKILIVEDDADTLQGLKNLLDRALACEILLAQNGVAAIEQVNNNDVDLLVLDIHMPEMSGLEVMRKIRETKELPDTIVVTAYESGGVAQEVMEAGALEYIPKPLDTDVLVDKIKEILIKKGKL